MARDPKSPQEKKQLSLERDRRNTYGENDKASRKNIPLSKAKSHRAARRTAKAGAELIENLDDVAAEVMQSTLATPRLQKGSWRKEPDTALGDVVRRKLDRRRKVRTKMP